MLESISQIVGRAKSGTMVTVAVAAAHDEEVLKAVSFARREGIAKSVLTGNVSYIEQTLNALEEPLSEYVLIPAGTDEECAKAAVEAVRDNKADFLMKGLLSTAQMMRAVLDPESTLRTGRVISHVMIYEVPGFPRLLYNTDGGMNTYPDLEKKADILENAATLCKKLGYTAIYASCICGAETVSPKIQATVDAAALAEMQERWAKYNMTVEGPVGLDLAISEAACAHKGYKKPGGGKADILLVPNYEVGNVSGKAMTYFAHAKSAGVIVGARVPIVLVSRSDDAETKLASIALAAVAAGN